MSHRLFIFLSCFSFLKRQFSKTTTIYIHSWKSEDSLANIWGLVDGQGLNLNYQGRVFSMSWSCDYLQEQRLNNLFSLMNSKQEIIGQDAAVGLSCKTKSSGQPCNRLYKNSLGISKKWNHRSSKCWSTGLLNFYAKHSLPGDQFARKILCYFSTCYLKYLHYLQNRFCLTSATGPYRSLHSVAKLTCMYMVIDSNI